MKSLFVCVGEVVQQVLSHTLVHISNHLIIITLLSH